MSDDIIRIDGVERELVSIGPMYLDTDCTEEFLVVRPKRSQTGWICPECTARPCIKLAYPVMRPTYCPYNHGPKDWKPFYGKVVE